jgi:hypothetical protein
MTNKEKDEIRSIIVILERLLSHSEEVAERRLIVSFQDPDRTYTTGERQLDQRLDCRSVA